MATDETAITPALTPAQWREALSQPPGVAWGFGAATSGSASRHALAAICLYGTPEGFTREDVALLTLVSARLRPHPMADMGDERERLADLADRIAALLPPE